MSLIADALKTAQREKQLRESGGVPSISPILVPLRPRAQARFSWQRTAVMGLSVFVTAVALGVMVQRMRKKTPPLAALPAVTRPIPSATIPVESAPKRQSAAPAARPAAQNEVARVSSARPRQPVTSGGRPLRATLPAIARNDTSAVLQGQPQSVGRLRIAVEHPRTGDAGRLFAEALAAHRAGDLVTARALYERVLLLTPNDADALNNLGVLLSGQRDFDRALELLRRAASIAPNNAGTWNNIGTALREQGRGSDAAAAFRHALTLDPQHQGAKVGLAQQYLASGSVAQARTLLEEVLSANPALPEAHYALGQALELQGDRVGAIRAYSEFIRRAPPDLAAYVERTRRHVDSLSLRAP